MKNLVIAVAVAAALTGCAGVAESAELQIVPGTISARPFLRDYGISALLTDGDQRLPIDVFASACQNGYGEMFSADFREKVAKNAVLNGNTVGDQIFTQLCKEGLPLARAIDAKVTPEQRAARERGLQELERERARRPGGATRARSRSFA